MIQSRCLHFGNGMEQFMTFNFPEINEPNSWLIPAALEPIYKPDIHFINDHES